MVLVLDRAFSEACDARVVESFVQASLELIKEHGKKRAESALDLAIEEFGADQKPDKATTKQRAKSILGRAQALLRMQEEGSVVSAVFKADTPQSRRHFIQELWGEIKTHLKPPRSYEDLAERVGAREKDEKRLLTRMLEVCVDKGQLYIQEKSKRYALRSDMEGPLEYEQAENLVGLVENLKRSSAKVDDLQFNAA